MWFRMNDSLNQISCLIIVPNFAVFFIKINFFSIWTCLSCSILFVELIAQDRCFLSLNASLRELTMSRLFTETMKAFFILSLFFVRDQKIRC